ncbi:MAG: phage tail protein [Kofleriaceae bacterium]
MPIPFPVNPHRIDPFKNFKFRIYFSPSSTPVAAVSKMSAVKKTTEAIEWREAGGPSVVRKMPGRTKYEPITFEAGVTHDRTFMDWAQQVNHPLGDALTSPLNFRREVIVEVLNMQGVPALEFTLHRAWPSEFQALPELDANANAIAIQTLKVEYEGYTVLDVAMPET